MNQQDFQTAAQTLAELDHLDVEGLRLLYLLEVNGEHFYEQLADRVDNQAVADLLRRNGREERGHARRIGRALSLKLGAEFQPGDDLEQRYDIPLPPSVGPDLLAAIVQGELDGDASYQKWAGAEPDPEVARLLRLNGREETMHGRRIEQAIALMDAS